MTGGGVTQLLAVGATDVYLTSNATFTFWKTRYNKHTNFALEAISQPFNTAVSFGSEAQITLNRNGDLIYYMYLVVEIPGISAVEAADGSPSGITFPKFMDSSCTPCQSADEQVFKNFGGADVASSKDQWRHANYGEGSSLDCCDDVEDCPDNLCPELGNVWAHWTNSVGQFIVKKASLVIGGSTVDTLYSDFLFMWEELSGKSGRRLTEMIGKRYTRTQLVCDSRQRRQLFVPLPFWFTQHSGSALSLASLQFHGVQLHVEFEKLEKCIVVSSSNVTVKNTESSCCLTPNDLRASLQTTYVYLDNQERERFATTQFEVLINQTQKLELQATSSQLRVQLNFNHPVLELIWAIRRQCHESCNNHFNFAGIDNRDPVLKASLYLNNQTRFNSMPGAYFRTVQPYQHHSNIPDCFVYVYSFALNPEDASPSGSCNFSRIDHVDLNLQLQDGLSHETSTLIVFARNWNVLRFREGLGGLAFAN